MPERHAPGRSSARDAFSGEDAVPSQRRLAPASPEPVTEGNRTSAEPSCRYLQPAVRNQMPAPAAQPLIGPVADQRVNTSRNIPWRPPRLVVGLAVPGLASEGGLRAGLRGRCRTSWWRRPSAYGN